MTKSEFQLAQQRVQALHRLDRVADVDVGRQGDLVQRLARPGDRRSLHIALADAGEAKYRQALPIHLDHVKRHFAAYIEDGEAAAVESALVRMANAVRRESGL